MVFFSRSQQLLNEPKNKVDEFIGKYVSTEPTKTSPITCMTSLNRTTHDKHGISCPVLATESGHIYFLDPQTFSVLHQVRTLG